MSPRPPQQGFTLIEALVALLILAVAAAGLIRAAEAHIDSIHGLETRAAAQLVAENRLVELGLSPRPPMPPEVEMLGRKWRVSVQERPTGDPDLRAVEVAVAPPGEAEPLVTLDGFVDAGTTTP